MRIIGNGFLARHMRRLTATYPHATMLAAGVSSGLATREEGFRRDIDLVRRTIRDCQRRGQLIVYFS